MLWYVLWLFFLAVGAYYLITTRLEQWNIENITKKLVLVTGCDSGFGRGLILKCNAAGIPTLAACLTPEGVESLKKEATGPGEVVAFQMNVRDDASIAAARPIVEETAKKHGGIHGIVNNAGIVGNAMLDDFLTVEDYIVVHDVNLLGVVRVTKAFLDLVKQAKGRIVNTASICGRIALPALAPYTCAKYAVEAFSDTLRLELVAWGIKVSIIEPGFFATPLTNKERIDSMVTNIWKRAGPAKQAEYGNEFYENVKSGIIDHLTKACSEDTGQVVEAYFHALFSYHPRRRYAVGLDANFGYIPMSFLPAVVTDSLFWVIGKVRRTPAPAASK
uniref:Estradiol 17-beta-dehydrogenase 2 n=1 Tax=Panagrellus redivivus TaxID=6233 RepID=A0A7E4ZX49_PANRE